MELPTYFKDFLSNIRLTEKQASGCAAAHTELRERLQANERLGPIIVNSFLQGSYKRSTIIKPTAIQASDVDVVIVTKLAQSDYPDPEDAMDEFIPFLEEHYRGQYQKQGRSFGIKVPETDLDLVITSAPSEEEQGILATSWLASAETVSMFSLLGEASSWKSFQDHAINLRKSERAIWELAPLYIPDREAKTWDPTHPLAQIAWTTAKNSLCNDHFVGVVKAIKWWRRTDPEARKYPKGYPLEHLIGAECPNGIQSVAAGVVATLENLAANYAFQGKPKLPDHGVPEHDVLERLTQDDFDAFLDRAKSAAAIARQALDADTVFASANKWRELFGDDFPAPPSEETKGGFTPRSGPSRLPEGRFAHTRNPV